MYVFGFNFPEVAGVTNGSFDNYLETVIYTLAFVGGKYSCGDEPVPSATLARTSTSNNLRSKSKELLNFAKEGSGWPVNRPPQRFLLLFIVSIQTKSP